MTLVPRHPHLADPAVGEGCAVVAADLDFHALDRLAAIDDRAVAAWPFLRRRADARQFALLDQLKADALARRHDRHRQGRLGQAIAGAEGAGLEAGVGEAVDERLHDVGPDHVGAVAGDPPARQVEAVGGAGLRAHPARADVVAEGRRIGEGGAGIAADEVEPGERAGARNPRSSDSRPKSGSRSATACSRPAPCHGTRAASETQRSVSLHLQAERHGSGDCRATRGG